MEYERVRVEGEFLHDQGEPLALRLSRWPCACVASSTSPTPFPFGAALNDATPPLPKRNASAAAHKVARGLCWHGTKLLAPRSAPCGHRP